jgi:hypothetical protein
LPEIESGYRFMSKVYELTILKNCSKYGIENVVKY